MLHTAERTFVVLLVLGNMYIHVLVLQALLASSYTVEDYEHSRQVIYRTLQVNSNSNVTIPALAVAFVCLLPQLIQDTPLLQIGLISGISLAIILFLGFGAFSGLFSADAQVLEIARSGLLV